jgi:hypothetical protein
MGYSDHTALGIWPDLPGSDLSAQETAGELHGIDDFHVSRAPAQIMGEGLLDLLRVRVRISIQKGLGCHNHSRRTVAALDYT